MTRWGFDRKAAARKRPSVLIRPFRLPAPAPVIHAPIVEAPAPQLKRRSPTRPSGGPLHRIAKIKGTRAPVSLDPDHPALVEGRTLFPSTVLGADDSPRLLIAGMNQRKIGAKVTKGRWRGMPIFTLTLAERETCPRSCAQWVRCYGNHMPFARRHRLDDVLIDRLVAELAAKQDAYPGGFVIRLHILGDFGSGEDEALSMRYVDAWCDALERFPALRVFGFTAHDPDEDIGSAVLTLNLQFPDRCRIRFSGTADDEGFGAQVIERREDSRHVVCPAQSDATDCCGTCGLCWTMQRTVEFVRH